MIGTWIQRGRVLAMGMPWGEDLDALADDGVVAVISLTERLPEGLPHARLRHLHLPIRDFHPPSLGQLEQAVRFIDTALAAGGAAAVHCGAGLGRTGTICAAWLVSQGSDAREAIATVRRARPGSVETRDQERVVALFASSRPGGNA